LACTILVDMFSETIPASGDRFMLRGSRQAYLVTVALSACLAATPLEAQGQTLGVDTTNFDKSVRPQDDFFKYVNGGWLRKVAMPPDASRWSAFNELREKSRAAMHSILEELSRSKPAVGGERRMLAEVYASFMGS